MSGSRSRWRRSPRRVTLAALATLGALALPAAASGGGWALVRLDAAPPSVRAGEPVTVGFTVLQHGRTPAGLDVLSEPPQLTATNADGRSVTAVGRPEGPRGHYVVDVTFPQGGSWTWEIRPGWFEATTFAPLTVAPAAAAPSAARSPRPATAAADTGGGDARALAGAAAALLGVAALLVLAAVRRPGRDGDAARATREATPSAP